MPGLHSRSPRILSAAWKCSHAQADERCSIRTLALAAQRLSQGLAGRCRDRREPPRCDPRRRRGRLFAPHGRGRGGYGQTRARTARGGDALAEPDDARESVNHAEAVLGGTCHQETAIVGSEIERCISCRMIAYALLLAGVATKAIGRSAAPARPALGPVVKAATIRPIKLADRIGPKL